MIIVPTHPEAINEDGRLQAVVTKVFDGDGFLARLWNPQISAWVERVPIRFAFIDAPEIEQPFGREAQAALSSLILGKTLRLDLILKEGTWYKPIDHYRRILCMGHLTEELGLGKVDYFMNGAFGSGTARRPRLVTRNIELEMLANGCAWVLQQYAFDHEAEYYEAQEFARQTGRGLWSANRPEAPWRFKARQRRLKHQFTYQNSFL